MMEIYGICPACKSVMLVPDDGRIYTCIACSAHPPLLHITDLFKACGTIIEGAPQAKVMELMITIQDTITKEMNKEDPKDEPIHNL